jgi:hypothetical protein
MKYVARKMAENGLLGVVWEMLLHSITTVLTKQGKVRVTGKCGVLA